MIIYFIAILHLVTSDLFLVAIEASKLLPRLTLVEDPVRSEKLVREWRENNALNLVQDFYR